MPVVAAAAAAVVIEGNAVMKTIALARVGDVLVRGIIKHHVHSRQKSVTNAERQGTLQDVAQIKKECSQEECKQECQQCG